MENNAGVSPGGNNAAYRANLVSHYAEDLDRRRRAERAVEEIRTDGSMQNNPFFVYWFHYSNDTLSIKFICFLKVLSDNLKIESVELFSRDNAREHRTERYELVFDNGRVIPLN